MPAIPRSAPPTASADASRQRYGSASSLTNALPDQHVE